MIQLILYLTDGEIESIDYSDENPIIKKVIEALGIRKENDEDTVSSAVL